jgi:alpha-glucosidase
MQKIAFACLLAMPVAALAQTLTSPDGRLSVNVRTSGQTAFSVTHAGQPLLSNAPVGLQLADRTLGQNATARKPVTRSVRTVIAPEIRVKSAQVPDEFNELTIPFRENFSLQFRAYNDAVAYRFITNLPDSLTVVNEQFSFTLPASAEPFFQIIKQQPPFLNNYEWPYERKAFSALNAPTRTQLPLLVDLKNGTKLLLTESDLSDYPGLYFTATSDGTMQAYFPQVVKSYKMPPKPQFGWDRTTQPTETYPYIARTGGKRSFPWRVVAVSTSDNDLLTNQIVYKLARPNALGDVSWVKPGKVAWDWWNDWNLTGVPFRAGINTDTYKHYVDFAAKNGLEYIILDDGWYPLGDVTKVVEGLDMPELCRYAAGKNVGVMLWVSWKTFTDQMPAALALYEKWGVKGLKIDFMDRDDQEMVNWYENTAKEAAKRRMLLDYHGAKPLSLYRTYPNVINFEGVMGLEQCKWSQNANPDMAVAIPFIRMFNAPLDYTPGAMLNAQKSEFRPINRRPMSLGTRCQQLALYVVYEAPLQMLSDSPSHYDREPECTRFIAGVPTVWDATVPLQNSVGQYVSVARKAGNQWFLGGMTNWSGRELTVDLSFLEPGSYSLELFQDGPNADRNGMDYARTVLNVNPASKLTLQLAPGGGFAGRITRN